MSNLNRWKQLYKLYDAFQSPIVKDTLMQAMRMVASRMTESERISLVAWAGTKITDEAHSLARIGSMRCIRVIERD